MGAELKGVPGELSFTVTVKRAATGKEETFQMVGRVMPETEEQDGSHPFDSGTGRSD